jgi:hypothetical protein
MSSPRTTPTDPAPGDVPPQSRRFAWPGSASTPAGPTGPEDYALINFVYLTGLAAVAALAGRSGQGDGVPLRELPVIGIAAFAAADVLAKQKVTTWLREPFVEEGADHKPLRPEGSGLRYALGELVTCTRCVGAWCALGLVGLRLAAPSQGRAVSAVLATAGANHYLQAAFGLLCEQGNRVKAEAIAAAHTVPSATATSDGHAPSAPPAADV